ncbi:hypothetical protein B484DRAFT_397764 [Ochromonadaceae sp. CCMP2298]|nr:hypothetical protein B484DRAFT_397764 [Ochromonadaceae sp. CCMP2298]
MLGLKETLRAMKRSYSLKACAAMTLGLCFHFLGYECARAASITLLAAKDSGLGNEAIPLTIAVGSPASGLVLYVYTKSIKKYGSKCTIRASFILCILVLLLMSMGGGKVPGGPHYYTRGAGKAAIICFYAFREIYVSLLSSQQWAFIAGTLDKSTSSYIVSFSGIVSIASAVGGVSIEQLVAFGGVPYLLTAALLATCASYLCAEVAFNIREQGGNPYADRPERVEEEKRAEEKKAEDQRETDLRRRKGAVKGDKDIAHVQPKDQEVKPNGLGAFWRRRKGGFWSDSWNLIKKHYLLKVST